MQRWGDEWHGVTGASAAEKKLWLKRSTVTAVDDVSTEDTYWLFSFLCPLATTWPARKGKGNRRGDER